MEQNWKDGKIIGEVTAQQKTDLGFASWSDVGVMLLMTILAQYAGGVLMVGVSSVWGLPMSDPRMAALAYVVTMALAVFGVLIYRSRRGGEGRWAEFSTNGFDPMLGLHGLLTLVLIAIVTEPISAYLPKPTAPVEPCFWGFVTSVVCAPFMEEILCRGIVLRGIVHRHGIMAGWIGSSVFFGLIHYHPATTIYAVLAGLVLGHCALKTRSLLSSVLIHAANNAICLWFLAMGWDDTQGLLAEGSSIGSWIGYAVAVLALIYELRNIARSILRLSQEHKNRSDE